MRKIIFVAMLACLCSCSKDLEQISEQKGDMDRESYDIHKIDEVKATEIANLYFNQAQTRSAAPLKMEYIVDQTMTRSCSTGKDTLAYILNKGIEDGFVIISSDDRVYPILAHSETGSFKYEKGDIVDTEFISRIGAYLEANKNNESRTVTQSEMDACYVGKPTLARSWSQKAPWDKYVIQEHPGCFTGCVAVATGMVMSHCKFSHNYHGITFEFGRITAGLKAQSNTRGLDTRVVNGGGGVKPTVVPYSYDVAVDYAAKLMYWIGKDVSMKYIPNVGSETQPYRGYDLLKKEGYKLKHSGLTKFNIYDAIKYLCSNNIIYMRGTDYKVGAGHAWVADACTYCVNTAINDTVIAEIHCDWGWDGSNNGFYSGEVFSPNVYNFSGIQYFAIGVE